MGETRVDLRHMLENLRDMYPGSSSETILTETIANALDARAEHVWISTDHLTATLTIADDGCGMTRGELERFHDLAISSKSRGDGIGFAGVGVKIGLLEASEIVTESRANGHALATRWRLVGRRRAPWDWVQPSGTVGARGTAVQIRVENGLSELLDDGFIETVIRRQFATLFDPDLSTSLKAYYPRGVRFTVNARELAPHAWGEGAIERAELAIRIGRKRGTVGNGYLYRVAEPLPPERRGVVVSVFGKTIRSGWEWLGLNPESAGTVGGIVEVPELSASLQTNKSDFIHGPEGGRYMAYRRLIQERVAEQLKKWGVDGARDAESRARSTRPHERDLEHVLASLAKEFPDVALLTDTRAGGQLRLPEPGRAGDGPHAPPARSAPGGNVAPDGEPEPAVDRFCQRRVSVGATGKRRRHARPRLRIAFEKRQDCAGIARLEGSTVWINECHPAYRRAAASRSTGYHLAVAVCLACQEVAGPARGIDFLKGFLVSWGQREPDR